MRSRDRQRRRQDRLQRSRITGGQVAGVAGAGIIVVLLIFALWLAIVGAVVFFGSMILHSAVPEVPALGWWVSVIVGAVVSVAFKLLK